MAKDPILLSRKAESFGSELGLDQPETTESKQSKAVAHLPGEETCPGGSPAAAKQRTAAGLGGRRRCGERDDGRAVGVGGERRRRWVLRVGSRRQE